MSFDLHFFAPQDGEAALDHDRALNDDDSRTWAKVVEAVAGVLDGTETHANESCYELDHPETGLQLSYFPGQLALTIPYWYDGDAAVAVEQQLRDIVVAIEAATGLVAYDPQAGEEFLATSTGAAAATFDHIATQLADEVARPAPSAPQGPQKQPWWRRLFSGD